LNTSSKNSIKKILSSGITEEEILQLFVENSEDILILTDSEMVLEYVSQSLESMLEIEVSEFIGKKINSVMENFPSLPLMKPNQKMVIPLITSITKQKYLIEFQFKPIYTVAGTIQAIFAIGKDVTDRELSLKKFKDTAFKEKELNQLKSRFVSMASHEFRTPLATILSSTMLIEILLQKDFGPEIKERIQNHLKKIIAQTNRLTNITSDVLLLEKSIQIDSKILRKKIQISSFLKEVVDVINHENLDRRRVNYSGPEVDKIIQSDPSLLTHIFRNLILNALKYSENALEPEVHLVFRGNYFEVTIKDYGMGIPKEDHEHIFGSFYRAKNVGNIKGTGLGLNIVKELTKKLNGEIWFASKVGMGSTFYVSFPVK
jgi:PAS domain S-box-containing protein